MKVRDLEGKEYSWNLIGCVPDNDETRPRSELHVRARALLKELYPVHRILEEVFLPGIKLFADFYVPHCKMVVETHGEQHYTFNSHFFTSKWDWYRARLNDKDKQDWCKINNIRYVELPYNESDDQWRQRINGGGTPSEC